MIEANFYTKKQVVDKTIFTVVPVSQTGGFDCEYGFLDESGCLVGLKGKTVPFIAVNGISQANRMLASLKPGADYTATPAEKSHQGFYRIVRAIEYMESDKSEKLRIQLRESVQEMHRKGYFVGQVYENEL